MYHTWMLWGLEPFLCSNASWEELHAETPFSSIDLWTLLLMAHWWSEAYRELGFFLVFQPTLGCHSASSSTNPMEGIQGLYELLLIPSKDDWFKYTCMVPLARMCTSRIHKILLLLPKNKVCSAFFCQIMIPSHDIFPKKRTMDFWGRTHGSPPHPHRRGTPKTCTRSPTWKRKVLNQKLNNYIYMTI